MCVFSPTFRRVIPICAPIFHTRRRKKIHESVRVGAFKKVQLHPQEKAGSLFKGVWKVDRLARAVTDIYFNFFPRPPALWGE